MDQLLASQLPSSLVDGVELRTAEEGQEGVRRSQGVGERADDIGCRAHGPLRPWERGDDVSGREFGWPR